MEGKDVEYKVDCANSVQAKTGLCQDVKVKHDVENNNRGTCPICTDKSFTVDVGTTSRYVEVY